MYSTGFRDVSAVKIELRPERFYCKKRVLRKRRSEEGLEGVEGEIREPFSDVFGVLFAENVRGSDTRI